MSELIGLLTGWSIGVGIFLVIFRFVYLPLYERHFAINLYGEDNVCRITFNSMKRR